MTRSQKLGCEPSATGLFGGPATRSQKWQRMSLHVCIDDDLVDDELLWLLSVLAQLSITAVDDRCSHEGEGEGQRQ